MNCYNNIEIPDDCNLSPCVSCGVPIVANFQIQLCHICQTGLEPDLKTMGYSKIACSETHRSPLG